MSYNLEGKKCKSCNAYLFEEDDVVVCPVCGAPHHRECYNALGHCALEHLHGTDEQYDASKDNKEEKLFEEEEKYEPETSGVDANIGTKCQMCGEVYDSQSNACPKCGAPNLEKTGVNRFYIDFLGGVPADTDLGDGVTADEAKRFVAVNTHKYVPKFEKMKRGKKASFNLLALFFPTPWFLSRKMYALGAFVATIEVSLTMLMFPFAKVINNMPAGQTNPTEMAQLLTKALSEKQFLILAAISMVTIIFHIILGVFGDWFYRKYVISSVKEIKTNADDIDDGYRRKGGVSLVLLLLGFFITNSVPGILLSFAGMI